MKSRPYLSCNSFSISRKQGSVGDDAMFRRKRWKKGRVLGVRRIWRNRLVEMAKRWFEQRVCKKAEARRRRYSPNGAQAKDRLLVLRPVTKKPKMEQLAALGPGVSYSEKVPGKFVQTNSHSLIVPLLGMRIPN
jgi:hypothetical protein